MRENEEKTYGKVRDRRLESHHWGRIYKGKHTKLALAICLKMKAEGVEGQALSWGMTGGSFQKRAIIWSQAKYLETRNPGVVCKPQLAHSAGNVLCDEA